MIGRRRARRKGKGKRGINHKNWLAWRDRKGVEPLRVERPTFALVCSCGTGWTQRAIDEFNEGRPIVAMKKHLDFWRFDPNDHVFSA